MCLTFNTFVIQFLRTTYPSPTSLVSSPESVRVMAELELLPYKPLSSIVQDLKQAIACFVPSPGYACWLPDDSKSLSAHVVSVNCSVNEIASLNRVLSSPCQRKQSAIFMNNVYDDGD